MIHTFVGRLFFTFASILFLNSHTTFAQDADASTLQGKVLVGYQGWFRCPGDGSPKNRWSRWFHGKPDPTNQDVSDVATRAYRVEQYPDVSGLDATSLCTVPNEKIGGKPAQLFSSFPKATSETHFRWMHDYNIDGALMQRFIGDLPLYNSEGDAVLRNAVDAAKKNGRVIAVEYDISGTSVKDPFKALKSDWQHLTQDLQITKNSAYLKEKGKPVVSIWGIGVKKRIDDPALVMQIVKWFKTEGHATVIGGVPIDWANPSGDGQTDPAWKNVYKELDVVQPWTPGRYHDSDSIAKWKKKKLEGDVAETKANHQEYMPVIFPGFSWRNSKQRENPNEQMNKIPRQQGKFLWEQAVAAKNAGATMIKIAMFDEVNEGTAIFKIAATKASIPDGGRFLTLDADGGKLPSDWYLKVAKEISRVFHGQSPAKASLPISP